MFNPPVKAYDQNPFIQTSVSFDEETVCSPKSSIFSAPSVHNYCNLCPQNSILPKIKPNNPYMNKYILRVSMKLPLNK